MARPACDKSKMRGMVIVTHRKSMFAAASVLMVLAALAERSVREARTGAWHNEVVMEPIATPHLADIRERDLMAAIYEKQRAQIAPPEASMPIGNRWMHTEPQNYPRWTPVVDLMGMPMALRESIRAAA
jgi:hypothetical protein